MTSITIDVDALSKRLGEKLEADIMRAVNEFLAASPEHVGKITFEWDTLTADDPKTEIFVMGPKEEAK